MKKQTGSGGFSLIELVVVIALLAVAVGAGSISAASASSYPAKKCAGRIDSMLSQCRVESMSRSGDVFMRIDCAADGSLTASIHAGGEITATEPLAEPGVSLSCAPDGGAAFTLAPGAYIDIGFSRETGAFRAVGGVIYKSVTATRRASYTVTMVAATGAHSYE